MSEYISKGIKDKDGNIARFEPPAPSGNTLGGISASNIEQIGTNKTNISTLKKHITGDLTDSDFQEDSTAVMVKTVPSGMGDYAAVKVIGGKTVKTKNLLKPQNGLKEATVNGITFTPVFDSNGYLEYVTANGTATANASFIVTKLKEDISGYILSLGLSQESVSYGIACELGVSPWTTYQTIKGSGEKTVPSITYTDTINVYVQVLKDATANNVKFYPMLRKSGTSSVYEPYHEDLWNAVTESVVAVGKNLFDGTVENKLIDSSGNITSNASMRLSDFIKVDGSFVTIWGKASIACSMRWAIYDSNKNFVRRDDVNGNLGSIIKTHTGYVRLCYESDIDTRTVSIYNGSENLGFIPYNETTLLMPDSIKSLPDWGCSAGDVYNYVDFENMVYHHKVGSVDMSNMVWTKNTAGIPLYYADAPTNSKVDGGAICSKFLISKGSNPTVTGQIRVHEPTYNKTYLYTGDNSMGRPEVAEYCKGVMLNYELATEELIDISDILHPIRCEAGGTITFTNEHSLDVPNTITYKKEVSLT